RMRVHSRTAEENARPEVQRLKPGSGNLGLYPRGKTKKVFVAMDAGVPCADVVRAWRDVVTAAGSVDGGWVRAIVPFSQTFGPVLAFVTIVIGWRWVSRDNNKRESRK